MTAVRFDEKILFKTRQHWIVLVMDSTKYLFLFAIPLAVIVYFTSGYSWIWTIVIFLLVALGIVLYNSYLWYHSWLLVGNQKVTLSVRNGIFSQYAMNVRYRNIRDCAVSKKSIFAFFLKYGTIFIRSSANEGDFRASLVPKVGKVYALVNALSRYSDEERASIDSIEALHGYHQKKEFTHTSHEEGFSSLKHE